MKHRTPLPTHEIVIEHTLIQYLRVQVDAKTRAEASASVEDACTAMLTRPAYLALAYRTTWEVQTNTMRLVDEEPSTPPSQQAPGTEARLIAALAQLTAAHADTRVVTDHEGHDTDAPADDARTSTDLPSADTCAICAALDVLMDEGQAALEERRQAYDDLVSTHDTLQAQCATLQAAHTRLEDAHQVLQDRHAGLSEAYYGLHLAQLDDADRDPLP